MKAFRILSMALVVLVVFMALGLSPQSSSARGGSPTPTPTPIPPSGPPAPAPLSPANGASVTVPFIISWAAVNDPSGIVAYNWQASPTTTFSNIVEQTTNGQTQDTVSGLPNGTYFWRVQAVNGNFVQGAWSTPQSFTVTGANAGEPGSPTLNPAHNATAFHPMEVIHFDWSAVPGAETYILDASNDPSFPIITRVHIEVSPTPVTPCKWVTVCRKAPGMCASRL